MIELVRDRLSGGFLEIQNLTTGMRKGEVI
jgi:hypothetical protein